MQKFFDLYFKPWGEIFVVQLLRMLKTKHQIPFLFFNKI